MKTLDRYVASYFFSSLVLCALTLVLIVVLNDLLEHVDDLVGRDVPFVWALVRRYGAQLPLFFQRFGSFVVVAAAMFAVARLQANNELMPMLAGGSSVFRSLAPVFVGALVTGALEVGTTEVVIPHLADLIRTESGLGSSRVLRPGIVRDDRGSTLFAGAYDRASNTLRWVTFRLRGPDGRHARTFYGDQAEWEPGPGRWRLRCGWIREREDPPARAAAGEAGLSESSGAPEPAGLKERKAESKDEALRGHRPPRRIGPEGVLLETNLEPIDVESLNERFSLLPFSQLRDQAYGRQAYRHALRVQLHQRLTGPLTHVLLCLLALPFVLRSSGRASYFWGILSVIVICSLFYLTTFFFYELGDSGAVSPFWAAWAPPCSFGLLGVLLWGRVPS